MMNTYWSDYVQKSEELYLSRALRFHDGSKDLWLKALQVRNGMKILEVGCGGGVFCHRIKQYLPDTDVTGLDFDTGHIAYARKKAAELNLSCSFVSGDACALPFEDNSFDLCFSHSVMCFCEPESFVSEQYRVLKPGGKMIVLSVINSGSQPESWVPTEECEEKELFDRLWAEARKNELSNFKIYDNDERHYFGYLYQQGFKHICADALAVMQYAPDCDNTGDEMAVMQMNGERLHELCSAEKACRLAPEALTGDEYSRLIGLIHQRYDKRIEQYKNGEKLWDFKVSTVLAISGEK